MAARARTTYRPWLGDVRLQYFTRKAKPNLFPWRQAGDWYASWPFEFADVLVRLDDVARSSYARITASCQSLKGPRWRLQARRYFLNGRHYVADGAKMNSFFRELKNRRVYRVALGYAVGAWLVIQIAFTVLPTFHVPEGLLQALVVLAALGFPAALMLAWTFDVTPSGIEKTPDGTGAVSALCQRLSVHLPLALRGHE